METQGTFNAVRFYETLAMILSKKHGVEITVKVKERPKEKEGNSLNYDNYIRRTKKKWNEKIIISLVSGYLVSMLPIWTIDSRMQEILLTFAVSFCILSGLIWIEERIQDIEKSPHVRQRERQKEKLTFQIV